MLRNTGLYWAAAMLLSGCDLFSTREFLPKPPEIRPLQGLSGLGDSVTFRVTESLWEAGARAPTQVISRKRLVFTALRDSLDGEDTLKILSLSVTDDSSGALLERSGRIVRPSSEGVFLENPAADSGVFLALPSLFVQGWGDSLSLGILGLRRELAAVDTLGYRGNLEEAWVIAETVLDGERPLAVGQYRYGASGLLKAEQTWMEFEWRDSGGAETVKAKLHRLTERL